MIITSLISSIEVNASTNSAQEVVVYVPGFLGTEILKYYGEPDWEFRTIWPSIDKDKRELALLDNGTRSDDTFVGNVVEKFTIFGSRHDQTKNC